MGELTDEQQATLDGQAAELEEARAARLDALNALLKVKRWDGDGGPDKARTALRGAARAGDGSSGAA